MSSNKHAQNLELNQKLAFEGEYLQYTAQLKQVRQFACTTGEFLLVGVTHLYDTFRAYQTAHGLRPWNKDTEKILQIAVNPRRIYKYDAAEGTRWYGTALKPTHKWTTRYQKVPVAVKKQMDVQKPTEQQQRKKQSQCDARAETERAQAQARREFLKDLVCSGTVAEEEVTEARKDGLVSCVWSDSKNGVLDVEQSEVETLVSIEAEKDRVRERDQPRVLDRALTQNYLLAQLYRWECAKLSAGVGEKLTMRRYV
jgi:hypothetical protein